MEYTTETHRKVWHDKHGWGVEVGPDGDSCGLVEIRYVESDGKVGQSISMDAVAARLVARAMLTCADELEPTHDHQE